MNNEIKKRIVEVENGIEYLTSSLDEELTKEELIELSDLEKELKTLKKKIKNQK